jgi:hypothetical protein
MKTACLRYLLGLALIGAAAAARGQGFEQKVELRPGWNSVWLEVDPPDRDPAVVFEGLPFVSVWTWSERVSATDFILNPGDAGWNRAQWLSFFPTNSPESVVSNLRAILPQRAYLIRLAGTDDVTWTVKGRPVLRKRSWVPDRFNLAGFPVDPDIPITFRAFFRPSSAHYDPVADRLEPIFQLSADGKWTAVAPEETMKRGVAYWVKVRGASDFVAPFNIELNSGELADFDATQRTVTLTLHNRQSLSKGIEIQHVGLTIAHLVWLPPALPGVTNVPTPIGMSTQLVAGGSSHRLVMGVDRSKLPTATSTGKTHETILNLRDQAGTLFHVSARALADPGPSLTGLWLGTAAITNVAATADSGDATGTGSVATPFPLRVLLHVDTTGQVTLLREVTMVFASTNAGIGVVDPSVIQKFNTRPIRLLTDPNVVNKLSPLDLRNGRLVGRRLTAPHFDFSVGTGQYQLPLTGTFALSNQLSGVLNVPADLPTNPFLHRYHPDHGADRSYAITRTLQLLLASSDTGAAGEDDLSISGTYSEVIEGLHKNVLTTAGSLSLRRISDVGTLNAE